MYIITTKPPYTPIQPKILIEGKGGGKVGTYHVTVMVFNPKGGLKDIKIANFDIYSKFRTFMITFDYTNGQLICKSHNLIAKFI